jgi:hypothetical protein
MIGIEEISHWNFKKPKKRLNPHQSKKLINFSTKQLHWVCVARDNFALKLGHE